MSQFASIAANMANMKAQAAGTGQATNTPSGVDPTDVDHTEILLGNAASEIRQLRRRNEILEAKVQMIDVFTTVLLSQPPQQGGGSASADISYALDRKVEELREARQQAKIS